MAGQFAEKKQFAKNTLPEDNLLTKYFALGQFVN